MNRWLVGNGYWCGDCAGTGRGKALDRVEYAGGGYCQFYDKCGTCKGEKRIPLTPEDIVKGHCPITAAPAVHTCWVQTMEYGRQ